MSSIDKLLIKGIRSFSPENGQPIVFYKPLTLIVGHNGAGKTTVIECLKMACTGELPPNTKSGQNFIHDPKVAGETEVKAQIKLRFYNASQQPFIVVRSFQLTQKKNALQFKALDNTIQVSNLQTGEFEAMPSRCSEINTAVPRFMGVSKAILDNVIFVHQEDSNWPLAEGKVLKQRFDEIFAATKYTKALEELRKMRTRQVQATKEMRLRLETLKTHKDQAARLRTQVADGEERASTLQRSIDELRSKIQECANLREEEEEKLRRIAETGGDLVSTKAKYDMLATTNAESYARLAMEHSNDELEMPEADLLDIERDLHSNVAKGKAEVARLERETNSALMQSNALREQVDHETRSMGRLQAEAESNARNAHERDEFLLQKCREAGVGPAPGEELQVPLTADERNALLATFQAELEAARRALDAAREAHRQADDAVGKEIDVLSAQISGVQEGVRMKEAAVRENEAKLRALQRDLDSDAGASKAALEAANARVAAKQRDLEEAQGALSGSSLEEDSLRLAHEMSTLVSQAAALRSERASLAEAADEASRMNFKAQELDATQAKITDLLQSHRHKLQLTLGVRAEELPAPGTALVRAVNEVLQQRRGEADAKAAAMKAAQAKVSGVEATLRATKGQLAKATAELEQLSGKLQSRSTLLQPGGVGATLEEMEKDRQEKGMRANHNDAYMLMFTRNIEYAEGKNKCRTCRRPFASTAEKQKFLEQQNNDRINFPKVAEQLKEELKKLEASMKEVKLLEPVAARHDALRDTEVPALQARVEEVEEQLNAASITLATATQEELEASDKARDALEALQEACNPLARLAAEAAERKAEVESLRATVRVPDAARSVGAVDGEIAELESRRAELESAKDSAAGQLARLREAVAAAHTALHRHREEALRLSSAVEKRTRLEAQRKELLTAMDSLTNDLLNARTAAAPLEEQKQALQRRREDARARARAQEVKLDVALRQLQTWETQLEGRNRTLAEYQARGGDAQLARTEEKLKGIRAKQAQAHEKWNDLNKELSAQSQLAAEAEAFSRSVGDLLQYQRSKAQEAALAAELDRQGALVAGLGDRAELEKETRFLAGKERELRSEADRAVGALTTVHETMDRASKELGASQYEHIDERHRRQLIDMRTTEMASADLDKFHKALERALLAFHTTKMGDINKIIKELWQKTYRNADIDCIQIRADTEGGAAQRSYNYRVVMVCGGVELDMRGRCSAGQRVLACLIIRLALAETFCLNCGILALDEPTTNLDQENAMSLAESLKSIMVSRQGQENFQLIVITHDEQFARHIGTREYAEFMWRISKDENQHSTLQREVILE